MEEKRVKQIDVVAIHGGEVVHSVSCTGMNQDPYFAQRVERGMLINMNRDKYFTRMVYIEEEE
jgi:hypothetical protein